MTTEVCPNGQVSGLYEEVNLASRAGSTSGGQKSKATRGDSDMRGTTPYGIDMRYRARRGAASFMEGSNGGYPGFSNYGV